MITNPIQSIKLFYGELLIRMEDHEVNLNAGNSAVIILDKLMKCHIPGTHRVYDIVFILIV